MRLSAFPIGSHCPICNNGRGGFGVGDVDDTARNFFISIQHPIAFGTRTERSNLRIMSLEVRRLPQNRQLSWPLPFDTSCTRNRRAGGISFMLRALRVRCGRGVSMSTERWFYQWFDFMNYRISCGCGCESNLSDLHY